MLTLKELRQHDPIPLPEILHHLKKVAFVKGEKTAPLKDLEALKAIFPQTLHQPLLSAALGAEKTSHPLRVGVLFSGGQAPGGHNVIAGLFDALHALHPASKLIGFLGGPSGVINNKTKELTQETIAPYRNQGGFDLIGSGRTKIETQEQLQAALATVKQLQLDGIVIVGGDDSNTNAAILAEYFLTQKTSTKVIGVPKTIDGDLQNAHLAISFGFDTACKIYSEMIGNIARDGLSAKKYYHFIRLMGRAASHITLECALVTHPNFTLISEEITAHQKSLSAVVSDIADVIAKRSEKGKDYGIILIPEGLIEAIPHCLDSLPENIQKQLLEDKDPHGNVNLSSIETEKLLIDLVTAELKKRAFKGKFSALAHFLGYEGRAGFPSHFDSNYCYALGHTAALLIDQGYTGYMSCIENLTASVHDWTVSALPLTMLMNIETRKEQQKPVIQKALVDLQGKAFQTFAAARERWILADDYQQPGPIQFFGDPRLTQRIPLCLSLRSR
jgi:pyrophosphate--fructose-6-phosphate 1-phosphotransferase